LAASVKVTPALPRRVVAPPLTIRVPAWPSVLVELRIRPPLKVPPATVVATVFLRLTLPVPLGVSVMVPDSTLLFDSVMAALPPVVLNDEVPPAVRNVTPLCEIAPVELTVRLVPMLPVPSTVAVLLTRLAVVPDVMPIAPPIVLAALVR